MDLITTIASRRSIRKYKDTPVSDDLIQQMLEMARLAPTGGNGQPNVFGIVRDAAVKHELAKAAGGQMWIESAPVVIACCTRLDDDPRDLPEDDFGVVVNKLRWGDAFWSYLIAYPNWQEAATLLANAAPLIPAEHIALTAAANGLSCCFVGFLDVNRASCLLKLPQDMRCLFLMPVGYADEQPLPQQRKSTKEISFVDVYHDEFEQTPLKSE